MIENDADRVCAMFILSEIIFLITHKFLPLKPMSRREPLRFNSVCNSWNYLAHASPSGVLLHLKYSSNTFNDVALGTGPTCGVWLKCITAGLASLNAGQVGTPLPLGCPYLAKLVQYVAIASDTCWSVLVAWGLPGLRC